MRSSAATHDCTSRVERTVNLFNRSLNIFHRSFTESVPYSSVSSRSQPHTTDFAHQDLFSRLVLYPMYNIPGLEFDQSPQVRIGVVRRSSVSEVSSRLSTTLPDSRPLPGFSLVISFIFIVQFSNASMAFLILFRAPMAVFQWRNLIDV